MFTFSEGNVNCDSTVTTDFFLNDGLLLITYIMLPSLGYFIQLFLGDDHRPI